MALYKLAQASAEEEPGRGGHLNMVTPFTEAVGHNPLGSEALLGLIIAPK